MPAPNIPNMAHIDAMGAQFKHNVFAKVQPAIKKAGVKSQVRAATARTNSRRAWANSVNEELTVQRNQQRTANKPGGSGGPSTVQPAQFRVQRQQVNNAHGEALKQEARQQRVMQSQRNFAHTAALKEDARRNRPVRQTTTRVNTPPPTPPSPREYPQAIHPGSSRQAMPQSTSNVSTPSAPQTISVGSWTAKPGGIAAAGSHLEAWAQTKTRATQARRKSEAAGGRDRGLATSAREWESAANQPLGHNEPPKE